MKTTLILFLLFFFGACNKDTLQDVNPISPILDDINSSLSSAEFKDRYLDLVNDHRRKLGLEPLLYSAEMESISTFHAVMMASGQVSFGHDGFSARCSEAKESFPSSNLCSEVVAKGPTTPESLLKMWLSSSGHRSKIESSRSTHTGLGLVRDKSGKAYYSELFLEVL